MKKPRRGNPSRDYSRTTEAPSIRSPEDGLLLGPNGCVSACRVFPRSCRVAATFSDHPE